MLVFFGTSHRSASFLSQALENKLKVDLVVSAPAKPVGKKQVMTQNPVITLAKEKKLDFVTDLEALNTLPQKPLLGFILDFQKIIPDKIINLFTKGIINVHFSRLPLLRGPAPVQFTILSGDKKGWISYYLINQSLDAGLIVSQTSLDLDQTETTENLYQKLISKTALEAPQIIDNYLNGKIKPYKQEGSPTFSQKLSATNCQIDWQKNALENDRLIRAAYPEPGAWSQVQIKGQAKRLKILKAHLENKKLVLDLVQLEGKKPVSWLQFEQGYPDFCLP